MENTQEALLLMRTNLEELDYLDNYQHQWVPISAQQEELWTRNPNKDKDKAKQRNKQEIILDTTG